MNAIRAAGAAGAARAANQVARVKHASAVLVAAAEIAVHTRVLRTRPAQIGALMVERLPQLGMTFVKMGQLVSTRPDVFGEEACAALGALRDRVRPMPASEVHAILAGHPNARAFAHVDAATPVASASIGQVHRARLQDGRVVALKVRRPGIADALSTDVALLDALVRLQGLSGVENVEHARQCLGDMLLQLRREADFMLEARGMHHFRERMQARGLLRGMRVPEVYLDLCTEDVIVMEYVPTTPLSAAPAAAQGPSSGGHAGAGPPPLPRTPRAIALALMDGLFEQVFQLGIVHGDPHPGNMGLDAQGRIVLYDFGNLVTLSAPEQYTLKTLMWQLAISDDAGATESLAALGAHVDDPAALRTLFSLYRTYARTVDVAIIRDAHDPAAPLPVRLPDKLMRLLRACSMLEGTCKRLLPSFSYTDFFMHRIDEVLLDERFLWRRASEDVRALMDRWMAR